MKFEINKKVKSKIKFNYEIRKLNFSYLRNSLNIVTLCFPTIPKKETVPVYTFIFSSWNPLFFTCMKIQGKSIFSFIICSTYLTAKINLNGIFMRSFTKSIKNMVNTLVTRIKLWLEKHTILKTMNFKSTNLNVQVVGNHSSTQTPQNQFHCPGLSSQKDQKSISYHLGS